MHALKRSSQLGYSTSGYEVQAAAFTVGLWEVNRLPTSWATAVSRIERAGHTLQDEILALEMSALTALPTVLGSRRLASRFH